MHFLQAINSDISVLIVCNKTGGTIKGDIKKFDNELPFFLSLTIAAALSNGRCNLISQIRVSKSKRITRISKNSNYTRPIMLRNELVLLSPEQL